MSARVENVIRTCQEEVKVDLIEETLNIYKQHQLALEEELKAYAFAQTYQEQEQIQSGVTHPDFYTTHSLQEDLAASNIGDLEGGASVHTATKIPVRNRREANEWYHPTMLSHEEKWIAGVRENF